VVPLLGFDEAVRRVRAEARALDPVTVPLDEAYGRVLAETVVAPHPVPPFSCSTVDGFAVRADDVRSASPERPVELPVRGEVMAGDRGEVAIGDGEAARIMTGAPVPPGADAIVMLEWTSWDLDRVRVERSVSAGSFIRPRGEDLSAGDRILEPGHRLGPAEQGVLASIGRRKVSVFPPPRVAVLTTGDELLDPEEELVPGKIRDSNRWTLAGQVREAGGVLLDLGAGRDDRSVLRDRVERSRAADVLLTSGGVSVGDRDRMQEVLESVGFRTIFWRVASSPGKPLLFGRLGQTLVFGLPGNPVSSMVAFEAFVRPTLRRLQGDPRPERPRRRAEVMGEITGPANRRHFARVRVTSQAEGLVVREVEPRGSGNLRSMIRANGLAILPEGVERVRSGDEVEVLLLGTPD
jgi:molybdopterin molybdotransferase